MANRAYLSIWAKNFTEATMLDQFERLLETVPFSAERPGVTELVIRAVDSSEAPLLERDLPSGSADAARVASIAREHLNTDSAYEVQTHWDLWVYDVGLGRWQRRPQRLAITCHGEEYDGGACAELGHFHADIGFEHFFTGHAGLLGSRSEGGAAPQHPAEAAFLAVMARPENFQEYHQKTRENIQQLLDWMRALEAAVPSERQQLWSEGEENFEARLDEILAVR